MSITNNTSVVHEPVSTSTNMHMSTNTHNSVDDSSTTPSNNNNRCTPNSTSSNIAAPEGAVPKNSPRSTLTRIKNLAVSTAVVVIVVIVVVAVTVTSTSKHSLAVSVTVTPTTKGNDSCDLTPSHKEGNFQEADFLISVAFKRPWSPDLNKPYSKAYNETLISFWDWVSEIFDHSLMSSCFSFLATDLINNGNEALVYLQLHVTCQNISENEVKNAYEEGYNELKKINPQCISGMPRNITVKKKEPIPSPSSIPVTMCGQSQHYPIPRIIGGAPTHRGQYPWVVLLLNDSKPVCGGTIWDYDIILTAAHCVSKSLRDATTGKLDTSLLDIIAGKWEFNPSLNHYEQKINVTSGRIHANYDEVSYHNDIALLKLAHPLQPTQLVMKVCPPVPTDLLPPKGIVAGWGSTSQDPNNPAYPIELQFVELSLYNYVDCNRLFGPIFSGIPGLSFYVNNGTLCAANSVYGGKDSCQGDSGGPLFQNVGTGSPERNTIFGIVSLGYKCGHQGDPGIYTLVQFYLDWINTTIPLL